MLQTLKQSIHRMMSLTPGSRSSPEIKYYGLYNQGATSYLNSVLQVLFMTKDFREALERYCNQLSSETQWCLDLGLMMLFEELKRQTTQTDFITDLLGITDVFVQSDVDECFEKIMRGLSSSEASQIFQGKLKHINKCLTCEKETSSDAPFWHLPLEMDEKKYDTFTLVDGIQEFFRESFFTGPDQIICQDCQQKSDAVVKCEMVHPPQVLTLMLKRFKFDYYYRKFIKNQQSVLVPITFKVEEKHDYELYAFVEHRGNLRSGHYTVKIKSQEDENWYSFDDHYVRKMDFQPFQLDSFVRSYEGYLLFYRKIRTGNTEVSTFSALNEKTEVLSNTVKTEEDEGDKVVEDKKHDVERQSPYVSEDGQETQDETGQSLIKDDVNKAERKENHPETRANDTVRKGDNREMADTGEEEISNKVGNESNKEKEMSDGGDGGRPNILNEQSDTGEALDQNKSDSDWKAGDVKGHRDDNGLKTQEGETSSLNSQKDEEIKLRPGKRNDEADSLETVCPVTKKKKASEAETDDVSTTGNYRTGYSSLSFKSPGTKYYGLYKQGATSYLSSVLQVLFMTKDFREALERSRSSRDGPCLDLGLSLFFDDLQKATTKTDPIIRLLGIKDVSVQSDAAECFEKIMTRLSSSEASQIFQGKLKHRNKCLTCEKETSSDSPFWNLPLELDGKKYNTFTLVDGIQEFFRESFFTGPDQIFCQDCQQKSDAVVKCEMVHPPQVLTLMLKRFKFDYYYRKFIKNQQSVLVPITFKVEEKHDYELYAFVEHSGNLRSGHYTVKIKSQEDENWYSFNDHQVRMMYSQPFQEDDSMSSDEVYLLFYRKIHTGNTEVSSSSAMNEKTEVMSNTVKTEEDEGEKVVEDKKHDVERQSPYVSEDGQETQDETGQSLIKDDVNKAERKENHSETLVNDTVRKGDNREMADTGEEEISNKVGNESNKEKEMSDGGDEGRPNILNEQSDEGKSLDQNKSDSDRKSGDVKGYGGDKGLKTQEGETSSLNSQKDEEIKLRPGKRNDEADSLENVFHETSKKTASEAETDDVSTTGNHRTGYSSLSFKSPGIKYYGLYKQGATSYLSSVLQVLFMTKDFREALERSRSSRDGPCLDLGLSLFFDDLQKATTKTDPIIRLLGIKDVSVQSDAAECFEKIMTSLSSSEASQIFQGKLKHIIKCLTCEKETSSDAPFWHLPLEMDEKKYDTFTLVDSIQEFFRESFFTGPDQILCQYCQQISDATVKHEMVHPPQVLTLMLKRFKFDKSKNVVKRLTVKEKHDYELYAFVEHSGSFRSGHYTVKIKSQDDEKWYYFSDDQVSLMDSQPFQMDNSERSFEVYLLFYRKMHKRTLDPQSEQSKNNPQDISGSALSTFSETNYCISEEDETHLRSILTGSQDDNEVLVTMGKFVLTVNDIKSVFSDTSAWLTDEAVNFRVAQIAQECNESVSFGHFDFIIWSRYWKSDGFVPDDTLQNLKPADRIFLPRLVGCSTVEDGNHFILWVLDFKNQEIRVYDSLSIYTTLSDNEKDLLGHVFRKQGELASWNVTFPNQWKQKGSNNCGVFVCSAAENEVKNRVQSNEELTHSQCLHLRRYHACQMVQAMSSMNPAVIMENERRSSTAGNTEVMSNAVKTEEDEGDKVVEDQKHDVERQSPYVSEDGQETQDETGQSLIKDDVNKAERKENHPETRANDTVRKGDNREMADTGEEESSNKVGNESNKEKHLMEHHNDIEMSDGGDEGRPNILNEQSDEGKALDQNKSDSDWKSGDVKGYGGDKGLKTQEGETSSLNSQKDEEIKLRPGKRNDEADSLETVFPETKKKKVSEAETDDVSTPGNYRTDYSLSLKGSSPGIKYYGLYKRGETSYLSSVLQVLFMTKDFREALERSRSSRDGPCLDLGLSLFFDDLQKATTKTDPIIRLLGIKDVSVQSDAAECFEKIMGSLSSSEASQIFQGKLKHRNKCLTCEMETSSDSPFWNLSLDLDEKKSDTFSVEDSITEFFRESCLTGPDQIFCQHCQLKSDATFKHEMVYPPQVLTLKLKRFKFDYYYRKFIKNQQSVLVPSRFTVEEKHDYELYAFVEHIGSFKCGYYTVNIKSQDDEKWYYFSDTDVRMMYPQPFQMENSVRSDRVYLLFYRKIHTGNTEASSSSAFNETTETIRNTVKMEEEVVGDKVSCLNEEKDETGNMEKTGDERLNLVKDDENKADKKENQESALIKYNNVIEEPESQVENNMDQQSYTGKPLRESQVSDGGDQGRRNNVDEQSDEGKALYHNMVLDSVVKAAAEKKRFSENPKFLEKNTLCHTQTPNTKSEENNKSLQDETANKRNDKGDQSLNGVKGRDEGPKEPGDDLKQKPRDERDGLGRKMVGEGSTELTETKRSDTEKIQKPVIKISPETLTKLNKSNLKCKVVETTETSVDNLTECFKSLSFNEPSSSRAQGSSSISGFTQTDPTQNEIHHRTTRQTHQNPTHTTRQSFATKVKRLFQMSQSGFTSDPVVQTTGPPRHPPKTTINQGMATKSGSEKEREQTGFFSWNPFRRK